MPDDPLRETTRHDAPKREEPDMRLSSTLAGPLALILSAGAMAADHTKDTLDKVQEKIAAKEAILVDVREKKEWDEGRIEGAVLVPLGELATGAQDAEYVAKLAKKLPKDQIIYCHCAKGRRALLAGGLFEKLGYDVRPLKQGYDELIDAGFPKAKPGDDSQPGASK